MKITAAVCLALLASLSACATSSPVAVSCPPPPPLPQAVEEYKDKPIGSASMAESFVNDLTMSLELFEQELRKALSDTLLPSPDSKPVPPGH